MSEPTSLHLPSVGDTTVAAYRWDPVGAARGVVRLTHGMGEHALRYQPLADALTARGYVVYAQDHRGHGATIAPGADQGVIGASGWTELVADIGRLGDLARAAHPGLSHVLVGHSMGSFASQQYLLDHSADVDAVVLTGTAVLDLLEPALDLDQPLDLSMFNAPFAPARTDFDWLSRDDAQVDTYIADPWCGFGLDGEAGKQMFVAARRMTDPDAVAAIRPDLPLLVAVGEHDPVGGELALVHALVDRYTTAGLTDVTLTVYPGARHEIFNETNADEVIDEVVGWIDDKLSRVPATMRQLRSLVSADGSLTLSLETVDVPVPSAHQVLVRVLAAPLNPSDIGLLLGMADVSRAAATGSDVAPVVTAPIAPEVMPLLAKRVGTAMPVGNEGSGEVVAAGESPEAQALLGRTVSILAGSTYGEYCLAPTWMTVPLPDGVTPAQGASAFVNPLTALGMVETMRREGHTALVHTAAASNLGQMLNRICQTDGIGLVNIVRREEQAAILRDLGATHICDSSRPGFEDDLTEALRATGATLAFDAIGGGGLVSQILNCMEAAVVKPDDPYSRYGSTVHKQVYVYGALDRGPLELRRAFGFAWGVGGWLLTPFLQSLAPEDLARLSARVGAEITTTFASHYSDEISLEQALDLDVLRRYAQQATGEKFLLTPHG